ncbi:MAG TPA: hypothetical protein VGV14_14280, partial [Rhodanobacter sp.]|nr:hypothetical protein [Rhodanobacter sp.]
MHLVRGSGGEQKRRAAAAVIGDRDESFHDHLDGVGTDKRKHTASGRHGLVELGIRRRQFALRFLGLAR